MSIRFIASVVIAALLMTGGAVAATQVTEYGEQPAQEAVQQNPQPVAEKQEVEAAVSELLTAEEAKAIALGHAGLKEEEVTRLRAEYDVEKGIPEWDIDFRSGDYEYDYEINAETGEVQKHEKEYDPVKVPAAEQEQPVVSVPAETVPAIPVAPQPEVKKLTAEEAQKIALTHAGLTVDQVKGLRAEYDADDKIAKWDVEFRSGDWEYDYEINAETGEVLKHDKEYDPVKTTAAAEKPVETTPSETQPKPKKLTAEEAKAIALQHAGLAADQVKGLRAEYDVDDGIPEWEVEFRSGGMEYNYEIHAETGKIRSWDRERDD